MCVVLRGDSVGDGIDEGVGAGECVMIDFMQCGDFDDWQTDKQMNVYVLLEMLLQPKF